MSGGGDWLGRAIKEMGIVNKKNTGYAKIK